MELKINVFFLDEDPKTCATFHNDRHVVKMIIEYSQLLSTAHRVLDGRLSHAGEQILLLSGEKVGLTGMGVEILNRKCYKQTHVNHPSNVWVRTSSANYLWLVELLRHLHDEWRYRYDHPEETHASFRIFDFLSKPPTNIMRRKFATPPLAMDDEFKIGSAIDSYRNYYVKGKPHLASWKKRGAPAWYKAA